MADLVSVNLGITNRCTNRCKMCAANSTGSLKQPQMPLSVIKQHATAGKALGARALCLTGGEPMLHPDFMKIINGAAKLQYPMIRVNSGGWLKKDSRSRTETLNNAMATAEKVSQGKSSFFLDLSFSPYAFMGDQNRILELWRTTLTDLFVLAPSLKRHWEGNKVEIAFTDVDPHQAPDSFLTVLEEVTKWAGENITVDIRLQHIEAFGRAANDYPGLPPKTYCSYFPPTALPQNDTYLSGPYVGPENYLFPCTSPANGSAPTESAIKLGGKTDLEWGINYYLMLKDDVADLRAYLYEQLGGQVSFCQVCIQARIKIFSQPHRITSAPPPHWAR